MVNELQARLHSLYAARVQLTQVEPQMAGLERYQIVARGVQLYTLIKAADRIAVLEAILRRLDRRGGLGLDIHAEIAAALGTSQSDKGD